MNAQAAALAAGMKRCTKCSAVKARSEFHKDSGKKDGLRSQCKACMRGYAAIWRAENPEYLAQWRAKNLEHRPRYYANNAEIERERSARWAKANPARRNAFEAKRKAARLQRTPGWSDAQLIAAVYGYAKWIEEVAGVPVHVDHIVPLQGKQASGLHCASNLQILPGRANCAKRNRLPADAHEIPCALDDDGFQQYLAEARGGEA